MKDAGEIGEDFIFFLLLCVIVQQSCLWDLEIHWIGNWVLSLDKQPELSLKKKFLSL